MKILRLDNTLRRYKCRYKVTKSDYKFNYNRDLEYLFERCRPDHFSSLQRPTKPKNTQKKPKNIRIQAEYGRLDLTQSQRNDDKHDGICQNMFVGTFIGKKRNTILVRSKALCGSLRRCVCCYETDRNISETNFMYC